MFLQNRHTFGFTGWIKGCAGLSIVIYILLYTGEVLYDIDISIISFVIFEKYQIKKE